MRQIHKIGVNTILGNQFYHQFGTVVGYHRSNTWIRHPPGAGSGTVCLSGFVCIVKLQYRIYKIIEERR